MFWLRKSKEKTTSGVLIKIMNEEAESCQNTVNAAH